MGVKSASARHNKSFTLIISDSSKKNELPEETVGGNYESKIYLYLQLILSEPFSECTLNQFFVAVK